MGEFKIILLLYSCFWIDNAHEHHYQFENLLILYLNTAIHLLFSKINSKVQVLFNNQFQSILVFYQRIPSYILSVLAWEGVGYSQYYSVLYGYSIIPSYPGTNCTCTIHVTATNPSVIPPLSLPKHTNISVVHRCIYKNNT